MKFRSLFIGIDKYESPLISNLSCSSRDAQALHGLFCDNFGQEDSVLLINGQATKAEITAQIEALQKANEEDVIVIGFSGHGSDSHHLITHDADPFSLDATAIHLDELTHLFSQIPSGNVMLLLDCCFAGGAGAKVFHAPVATKAATSAEALLAKISGKGRLIFTAATADQEAIEDRRRGHGFFTFYLVEALRGAPEVAASGRIPILSLIEFVTKSVVSAGRQIHHTQEPTLKGSIEGEFTFPILVPGKIFQGFFPKYGPIAIGADVRDLGRFGFPDSLIDVWAKAIPSLNELQQDAINKMGLLAGEHLVVSAPTSSGKTMIGELAMIYRHLKGERSYMLLPLRALVNDKYEEFSAKYGAFGLRVIRSTGEISDDNDALMRGKFDIALLTYEHFGALAVSMPHIMRQISVVVVDEVQMITDINRGANLEFVLTLLKVQRIYGVEPQIIALSAVIGDTNGLEAWLNARLLRSEKRPVPLDEGLLSMDGSFRFIDGDGTEKTVADYLKPEFRKGSSQDLIIPLVRNLVKAGEKIIVFRETKPIVRATANYLKENLGFGAAAETIALLPSGDPSVASAQLRECLEGGIAFHNADLDREERQAVEATFRDPKSSLRVLVATTTLAMGVNTPAWSVIIAGLEHPDGPYTVAEYKNMVGRAGRLGFTPKGKSFLVAANPSESHRYWNSYITQKPEALISRFFGQDPLSLICRVLATAAASKANGLSKEDLINFVQSTFAGHQKGETLGAEDISHSIDRLNRAGLVESLESRFRLTELGKVSGELGIQVESVVRIARAIKGLGSAQVTERTILAAAQVSAELDNVIFPVHRKSIKEQHRWRSAIQDQRLPQSVLVELRSTDEAGYTTRCKRLCAVLMWLEGTDLNRIEESLLQHLPGDNAAGPIRSSAERTRDLVGAVTKISSFVSKEGIPPDVDLDVLRGRLELGIPADIFWLAKETRRRLERGDYLALRRAGVNTIEMIEKFNGEDLQKVLKNGAKVKIVREALERIKAIKAQDAKVFAMPTPPAE